MKLCECGCGEPAPTATKNDKFSGHVKGQYLRFISGHQCRGLFKAFCKRGHERAPENVDKWGACKACRKEYQQTEAHKLAKINDQSRRRGAVGEVSIEDWRAICAITGDCCACCGLDRQTLHTMGRVLAIDHIRPISKGGSNWPDNVQPLCHAGKQGSTKGCNNIKGTQTINYLTRWQEPQVLAAAA